MVGAAGLVAVIGLLGWTVGAWSASAEDADDLLVIGADGSVELIDIDSGTARYAVPNGTVSPDRSTIFSTRAGVGATHIESWIPRPVSSPGPRPWAPTWRSGQ
ncbi:MAG: hypothetical protein R2695_12435 [Acidimicrobiales bacterium]